VKDASRQRAGRSHLITYKGRTLRQAEWADKLGISRKALTSRLARGGTIEDAFNTPVKKRVDTTERRAALYKIVQEQHPITVRGVFYQAEVRGIVGKDENGYKMVQTDLTLMRKSGELPYEWIVDNTRQVIEPYAYDSVADALAQLAQNYRVSLWKDTSCLVQVWLEKDALSGVVEGVTLQYGVPLMVARGYSSLSFLHEQAAKLRDETRLVFVYLLGDYDPSGVNAHESIKATLREMAPGVDFEFKRPGVTEGQIKKWKLPTRLTKQSDSRSAGWGDNPSVELDAIEPNRLRKLVKDAINIHMTDDAREELQRFEADNRERIMEMARGE
jgi:hypothetical protein